MGYFVLTGRFVIEYDDLEMVKLLGKGNFGEVWLAKYHGNKDVAVKRTLKGALNDQDFVEEARIMM